MRERVGGLGLAVVCAGRQCERTASVLPVRGLPGSIIALVVKDTADGVSSQTLKGAQVTAMESDSAVSVIETGSSGQRTQQMLDHLADKVNGVILSTDAPGISFICEARAAGRAELSSRRRGQRCARSAHRHRTR